MGFYSQIIFPRLCDFSLGTPVVAEQRRKLLADAGGRVLEIGFGTGLNLPHYPTSVRKITIVEPNDGMTRFAQRRIENSGIEVDRRVLSGEQLPFGDNTFNCVVSTFTLCSIRDVSEALAEVHRVLAPGGTFLFLEHGLSPESGVQKWQRRLNWIQTLVGDGCRLDRPIQELVAAQPFSLVDFNQFYLDKTPKTHGYVYRGIATK